MPEKTLLISMVTRIIIPITAKIPSIPTIRNFKLSDIFWVYMSMPKKLFNNIIILIKSFLYYAMGSK